MNDTPGSDQRNMPPPVRSQQMSLDEAIALGVREHMAGRLDQAQSVYRQILAAFKEYFPAMVNLASVLRDCKRLEEALPLIRRALEIQPDEPTATYLHGAILRDLGRQDEAMELFRRFSEIRPQLAEGWRGLGNVLRDMQRLDESAAALRRAVAAQPSHRGSFIDLARTLQARQDHAEAAVAMRRACELMPEAVESWLDLAAMLTASMQFEQAEQAIQRALTLKPNLPDAFVKLGNLRCRQDRADEAIAAYEKAMAIDSDCVPARYKRAMLLLLKGRWLEGWKDYEWRWKDPQFVGVTPKRRFPLPHWDGRLLKGRRILIFPEQGFGDVIQFLRYLPMVRQRGGHVIFEMPVELSRLLGRIDGADETFDYGKTPPPHDIYCSLMSLPAVFETTEATVPAKVPYLSANPADARHWRHTLAGERRLKVGLCWKGNPRHANDAVRSISAGMMKPLMECDAAFYSLAVKDYGDLAELPPMRVTPLGPYIRDFADTAAIIEQLDLVISVDTAVAHLAGALGRPVWLMLFHEGEWRWLENRTDSPWYPTMRIFRQPPGGEKADVIRAVAEALSQITTGRAGKTPA